MRNSNIPLCSQIRTDGNRCRSAAIRGEQFCYYHISADHVRRAKPKPPDKFALHLPVLDCQQNIHAAIDQVVHAIASGQMDPRRASVLIRAIQFAHVSLDRLGYAQIAGCEHSQASMPVTDPETAKPLVDASKPAGGGSEPAATSATPEDHGSGSAGSAVSEATPTEQRPTGAVDRHTGNAGTETAAASGGAGASLPTTPAPEPSRPKPPASVPAPVSDTDLGRPSAHNQDHTAPHVTKVTSS
jgi:hypothetical protein